jgi:hypothetical protein
MIKVFPTTPYPPPYLRRGNQVSPSVLSFIRRGNHSVTAKTSAASAATKLSLNETKKTTISYAKSAEILEFFIYIFSALFAFFAVNKSSS